MPDLSEPMIQLRRKDSVGSKTASRGFFGLITAVLHLPARAAAALVWFYQKTISPALFALNPSCGCRFAPTCSQYAHQALRERGLVTGLFLTLLRLVKCGPWHPGGEDAVPPRRVPACTKVSSV
jgi:putative membrane protein insertion efficiency factor